jgi:hypothetical protein
MARGGSKQKAEAKHTHVEVHEDSTEAAEAVARPRSSKFKEGTMNSTMSIHPPPDEFWNGLDIENMIKGFNEENNAPVSATGVVLQAHTRTKSTTHAHNVGADSAVLAPPPAAPASEGAFGRIWRPISTFFNGAGASFSALGKRKAGSESAETKTGEKGVATDKVEKASYDSKEDVEAAYHRAREQGLMPTPKVFIRPVSRARKTGTSHLTCIAPHLHAVPRCEGSQADLYILAPTSAPGTPTASNSSLAPPRTPTLYKSPSKKDLQKQQKLFKRVSELESKLASARKELGLVLASPNAPPVPPIPANLPSPATLSHVFSENETSPHSRAGLPSNLISSSKVLKKRKVTADNDEEFKQIATDSEPSHDSERETKRNKQTPPKKLKKSPSARLLRKKSTVSKEEVVIMVPDGVNVPPIPSIPKGVKGKKAAVRNDDGYGGFGDEMF